MRISARTDYAIRAAIEMAAAPPGSLVKAETIAESQRIPLRFLLGILNELRHAGVVESRRGAEGGYRLAHEAGATTVADIIRAIDGPLANVGGVRPESLDIPGVAAPLREVWISLRASIRGVLEQVTLADIVSDRLPRTVAQLSTDGDAWEPH